MTSGSSIRGAASAVGLAALLVLAGNPAYVQASPDARLMGGEVAIWQLDTADYDAGSDTSGDSSGNGHHARLGSAIGADSNDPLASSGRHREAFSFTGSDSGPNQYLVVPDATALQLTDAATILAWVRPTSFTHNEILLAKGKSVLVCDSAGYVFGIADHGRGDLPVVLLGDEAGCSFSIYAFTSVLPLDVWSHLAFTFNGTEVVLYVNGTLDGSFPRTRSIATGTLPLVIGADSNFNGGAEGSIDEVRIYNRALSSEEVLAIASAPYVDVPGAPQGLAAAAGPGAGEISLSWSGPADDGGDPVDNYVVYRDGTALPELGNVLSFVDTGLANGATHTYEVSAKNLAGEGPKSASASATTFDVPTAPRNLTASASVGFLTITLAWEAPEDDGGDPVDLYRIWRSSDRDGTYTNIASVTAPATTYDDHPADFDGWWYHVTAENAAGEGPQSNTACAVGGDPAGLTEMEMAMIIEVGCTEV